MSSDYFMRQIEDITRIVASVIFARRLSIPNPVGENGSVTQAGMLMMELRALLDGGNFNAAENLLFDAIETDNRGDMLPLALDFYELLARTDDDALAAGNFARQEITEGLLAVCRHYNIDPKDDMPPDSGIE